MNILYYDNCWFTNVGEAFIDIGAMALIRSLYPKARIATISNMSNYYCPKPQKSYFFWKKHNCMGSGIPFELDKIVDFWKYDLLVLAGMFMSQTHLAGKVSEFVRKSCRAGAKVAFVGLGAESGISDKVVEEFNSYLDEIRPIFVSTRDKKTYNLLSGVCVWGRGDMLWD